MHSDQLKRLTVFRHATLFQVIEAIDAGAKKIAIVVSDENKVLATVTDGDIRRALLRGCSVGNKIESLDLQPPITSNASVPDKVAHEVMTVNGIHHLPIVNDDNVLVDLKLLSDKVTEQKFDTEVVIMAGGLGRRLRPLTDCIPKPMLEVGGRPILENIILNIASQGFVKFTISVNYRHEVITDFFGDGSRYELNISYIHEDEPMGTVGALSLMQNRPKEPFVVMNGDLVSQLKLAALLRFHRETDALATICGREYLLNIPYGVIEIDGSNFLGISEKPTISRFVNAGIYVLSPKVLDLITERERLDMPDLLDRIKRMQHRVSVFPIMEYWRDIGRFEDLEEVRQEFLQN